MAVIRLADLHLQLADRSSANETAAKIHCHPNLWGTGSAAWKS